MELGRGKKTEKKCPLCGCTQINQGKLHGTAALQPLESHTGLGGSALIFTFCGDCGEVLSIRVKEPAAIK